MRPLKAKKRWCLCAKARSLVCSGLFLSALTTLAWVGTGLMVASLLTSPVVFLSGCATSSRKVAYQTLASVEATVDAAMQRYADLVVRGQVPADIQAKVKQAYEAYQTAFHAAVTAAQLNVNSAAPADVAKLGDDVANLIKIIK
jgi:hypothetical protein